MGFFLVREGGVRGVSVEIGFWGWGVWWGREGETARDREREREKGGARDGDGLGMA